MWKLTVILAIWQAPAGKGCNGRAGVTLIYPREGQALLLSTSGCKGESKLEGKGAVLKISVLADFQQSIGYSGVLRTFGSMGLKLCGAFFGARHHVR